MSDIFISYSSKDRRRAQALARALETRGWSVWWDRKIPTGKPFDQKIAEALNCAKCVIVLWSSYSVTSDWVKSEAAEGKKREVLLPCLIEKVELPLEFNRLQTASLVDWRKSFQHPGFVQLLRDIAAILGRSPLSQEEIKGREQQLKREEQRKRVYALLLLSLPTVIVVIVAWLLMNWRIPTHVQVNLTVDRAEFTIGQTNEPLARIFNSVRFRSITFERFVDVSLQPQRIEVADPNKYDLREDRFPDSAWMPLAMTSPTVNFTSKDEIRQPALSLERTDPKQNDSGTLDPVRVSQGAVITLEVTDEKNQALTMKIAGPEPHALLSIAGRAEIIADQTGVTGLQEPPYQGKQSLTYRVHLRDENPVVEITGKPNMLVINLKIPPQENTNLFSQGSIPVVALDFTRQGEFGRRESTLVASGKITYPEYPGIEERSLTAPDVIGLDELKRFSIQEMSLDPSHQGIRVRVNGLAGHVMTKAGDFKIDHRLTAFDSLRYNKRLVVILTIFVWLFPTTIGAYRIFNELNES